MIPTPDLAGLGFFVVAALVLLLTPGPAVLYIVARSIDQGRRAGLVSMLGVHAGTLVHIAAAAAGLSALLAASAMAFSAVKYLGAAYLVYLGVRRILASAPAVGAGPPRERRLRRAFIDGVVVNVLNPKTALFFLAFLPQFVDVERGAVWSQMVVLGFAFIALGMISDGTYAFVAARAGRLLRSSRRFRTTQRYVSGGIYIGLGAVAAFAGSHRSD
jgi:threonine/homoserine/homoserine lactone efflux protein